jgi:SAM-dependent methyltransferase
MKSNFDQYAEKYDAWFLKNKNVLYSELKLVAFFLKNAGDVLSVGCGSGLFEMLLQQEYKITVKYGIEPSKAMAEIAGKRGMIVRIETAEEGDFGQNQYDTILFNGTPSYINDLQKAFNRTFKALRTGGKIVVIDVPKESSYAMLYNLAKVLGTWSHPLLEGIQPKDPYPIEFVKSANWRTTMEKTAMLNKAGFTDFAYAQTLTKHPVYSDNSLEEPREGFDCGDYVAICAYKNK